MVGPILTELSLVRFNSLDIIYHNRMNSEIAKHTSKYYLLEEYRKKRFIILLSQSTAGHRALQIFTLQLQ